METGRCASANSRRASSRARCSLSARINDSVGVEQPLSVVKQENVRIAALPIG